jgi:hypothetical protein
MKTCTICKTNKDNNCFGVDNSKSDGLACTCKSCLKIKRDGIKKNKCEYDKEYRKNNRTKLVNEAKIYQKTISNEIRALRNKKYRHKHREEFNRNQLKYIENNKYKFAYRTVLFNFLTRTKTNKNNSTSSVLGYDAKKFKERIELNFKEGMDWNNHGKWHIDHKKPISMFKEGTPANIVNSLCNLQPLWAKDNLIKGNKLITTKHETN